MGVLDPLGTKEADAALTLTPTLSRTREREMGPSSPPHSGEGERENDQALASPIPTRPLRPRSLPLEGGG